MLSFFLKVLHLVNKFGEQFSYQKTDSVHKFLIDLLLELLGKKGNKGNFGLNGVGRWSFRKVFCSVSYT